MASRLAALKMRRDELQEAMQRLHDEGNVWIDNVIQCFELAKMATEAIRYGTPEVRQGILKALALNYVVKDGKLEFDFRKPFQEVAENKQPLSEASCTIWGVRLCRLLFI